MLGPLLSSPPVSCPAMSGSHILSANVRSCCLDRHCPVRQCQVHQFQFFNAPSLPEHARTNAITDNIQKSFAKLSQRLIYLIKQSTQNRRIVVQTRSTRKPQTSAKAADSAKFVQLPLPSVVKFPLTKICCICLMIHTVHHHQNLSGC